MSPSEHGEQPKLQPQLQPTPPPGTEPQVANESFVSGAIARLAALMSGGALSVGAVTALRRFDPVDRPGDAAFEVCSLLDKVGIKAAPGSQAYEGWSVVLHCLALTRGNHSRGVDVGTGLVGASISETRARQLLESDRPMLFDLLPRIARRLAASSQPIDWVPLARLALSVDADEAAAQRTRLDIAHRFQRALSAKAASA